MSRAEKRRGQTEAALIALQAAFPAAFPTDPAAVRPLALRVRERIEATGTVPSRTTLHRALWLWTRQSAYLAAIAEGRPRINLDGSDAGAVTPEHQAAAAAWLEKLRAKGERRAAAAASPEPAAAPVSEPAAPMPEPAPARPVLSLKKPLTKRKPT
ncbi:MAG TPA: ProQ/FinO family protein [Plasticicumulans sp.]|nr:ProQ/FinO family protein [Plasticicumulans sp.]